MNVSIKPSTQDKYFIRALDTIHINPSLLEGENFYESPLGFRKAKAINYYAPVWIVNPYITGNIIIFSLVDGEKIYSDLICNQGIINASERARLSYQWFQIIDNEEIPVLNKNTRIYSLREKDYNIPLFCKITARNRSGTVSNNSNIVTPQIISPVENQEHFWGIVTGLNQIGNINTMSNQFSVISGIPEKRKQEIVNNNIITISGMGSENKQEVHTNEVYTIWFPVFHKELFIPNHNAEGNISDWNINESDITIRSTSPTPDEGNAYFSPGSTHSDSSVMNQTINISSEDYTLIDSGESYITGWWRQYQKRTGEQFGIKLSVIFLSSTDVVLKTTNFLDQCDVGIRDLWHQISTNMISIPVNTRKLKIEVTIYSSGSSSALHTYFDDLHLEIYKETE